MYITNLEDGLRKDGTALHEEKDPNENKPAVRNRPIEVPFLNNPNHIFDIYGESDSDVIYIEDFLREKQERILKNTTTLTWTWRRKESKPTYKNRT